MRAIFSQWSEAPLVVQTHLYTIRVDAFLSSSVFRIVYIVISVNCIERNILLYLWGSLLKYYKTKKHLN